MKKCLLFAVCSFVIFTQLASAELFYLQEKSTGKIFGPFSDKTGAKVLVDKKEYVLVRAKNEIKKSTLTVEQKLKIIKIPKIDFRAADMQDVVTFLRYQSKAQDPDKTGVNIILNVKKDDNVGAITFSGSTMTLEELLNTIAMVSGLSVKIRNNSVLLARETTEDTPRLFTRTYAIEQWRVQGIKKTTAKAYFEGLGAKFPEGAFASYDFGAGRLIVSTTLDSYKTLEPVLKHFSALRRK